LKAIRKQELEAGFAEMPPIALRRYHSFFERLLSFQDCEGTALI
jgi:hypothetical protein